MINKEAIELLVEEARRNLFQCNATKLLDQALALLKEQPPAGEPISLERQNEILFEANRNIKARLDASEASRKKLVKASKNLSVVCQKIGLTDDQNMRDKLAQAVVRIEAAIK